LNYALWLAGIIGGIIGGVECVCNGPQRINNWTGRHRKELYYLIFVLVISYNYKVHTLDIHKIMFVPGLAHNIKDCIYTTQDFYFLWFGSRIGRRKIIIGKMERKKYLLKKNCFLKFLFTFLTIYVPSCEYQEDL
jgi:hypothetical protein